MITLLSKSASVSLLEINVPIMPFFDEAVDSVPFGCPGMTLDGTTQGVPKRSLRLLSNDT